MTQRKGEAFMYVLILNILVYAHDSLMLVFYYSKTLGRRYSMKVTAMAAIGWWIFQGASKLPLMYLADDYNMNWIMIVQCAIMMTYLLIFYRSSIAKKLLSFMLLTVTLGIGEFTTVLIVGNIFDIGNRPLEFGSEFTVVGLLIMRPLATLAYYIAFLIWNLLQRSSWVRGIRQWLCVLLPLSQTFLLWYLTETYTDSEEVLPVSVLTGVFLALAADIYMFVIFDRAQKRENIEKELRFQKRLHEIEQIRYNRLRMSLEETARLRHDYQNYLLAFQAASKMEKRGKNCL